MPELNYDINATVTGGEDVTALKDDLAAIEENPTVTVDAGGITEAATGLESIETSGAPGTLDDVGTSAGNADVKVGGLGGKFKEMLSAIGLVEIASRGFDFIMGKIAEKKEKIAQTDAFDAAQVELFADALRQAGDDVTNLVDGLEGVQSIIGSVRGEDIDITGDLHEAGITADEYFRILREEGGPGIQTIIDKADEAGVNQDGLNRILFASADIVNNLGDAEVSAADSGAVFAESQTSANAALQEILNKKDPMRSFGSEWDLLMESISDGSLDTTAAANALNTIADGLGLTTDQVLTLAQAEVDRVFEEAAAGAQAFADAVSDIDFDAAELVGATTAFGAFTDQLFAAGNEAQAREAAFDALAASVEGSTFTMNMSTDAGRAQQDALEGVARVIDTDLAQAYDTANGSQEAFIASATQIGDETLARLKDELNLTDAQVATLANTLGLTATDYEARFNLAGEEEARLQLELLQGAIEGLPPEVELRVNTLIAQGELVAARDEVTAYYSDPANAPTATVTVEADTAAATGDIEAAATDVPGATIVADADTVTAATDLLTTALEPRTATIVAHAHVAGAEIDLDNLVNAARTANINVNAQLSDFEREMTFATRTRTVNVTVHAANISGRFGTRWS